MPLFLIFFLLFIGLMNGFPIDISEECGIESYQHAQAMTKEFPELELVLAEKLKDNKLTVRELTDLIGKYNDLKRERERTQINQIVEQSK